jgi:uncharacterized protein (TIGR01777 family)
MVVNLVGQRIVVTGASGLVGRRVCAELEQAGAKVIRAVRGAVEDPAHELHWDPVKSTIDAAQLEGIDGVVHLAGENIAGGRWTEAFKRKIRDTRVNGTRLIAEAIAGLSAKPQAFVCASAIGYYGDRGDETMSESSAPGNDFLARVCREWEAACQPARDAGVRVLNLRIGVVLSPEGGALKKMLRPFRLGVGGKIGSGRQFMSWVAIDDVVGAIVYLLAKPHAAGAVNVVAPHPVTNAEFTKTLGRVLSRPTFAPMPALAARLAFGEMADALLLSSTRVTPQALTAAGYQFRQPELEPALRHLLSK